MPSLTPILAESHARHAALRLTADEYFALPDDGNRYELLDGITIMSPSPTPRHQRVLMEIAFQLESYLRLHPLGVVFPETDVQLSEELVYRPELVYLSAVRATGSMERIRGVPELVVEVVSPQSRSFDTQTKRSDYESHGVVEYWIIDPELGRMTFLRLESGKYAEAPISGDRFLSQAVPGFALELAPIRQTFVL